jgi:hypothetical protein
MKRRHNITEKFIESRWKAARCSTYVAQPEGMVCKMVSAEGIEPSTY